MTEPRAVLSTPQVVWVEGETELRREEAGVERSLKIKPCSFHLEVAFSSDRA